MIKIENGIFYITCGDACKIVRTTADNRLVDVCFGKRVEFEDDLVALGMGNVASAPAFAAKIRRGGKSENISAKLVLKSAEVVRDCQKWSFPTLRAEKSLKLTLACDGMTAEVYITPHARGGISERCALVNTGKDAIELSAVGFGGTEVSSVDVKSMFVKSDVKEVDSVRSCGIECAAAVMTETGADARQGAAVGLYALYGGRYTFGAVDGRVEAVLAFADRYTLGAGERFETPELLYVYSDCGTDGLARAMHDIVRERLIPEKYIDFRRPISFRVMDGGKPASPETVKAVGHIGGDTFVTSIDCYDDKALAALAPIKAECDTAGMRLGVACVVESVDARSKLARSRSELFTDKVAVKDDVRVFDLAKPEAREFVAARIEKLVGLGVRHIVWEPQCTEECKFSAYEYEYMKGFYALLGELTDRFPDVIFEGGGRTVDIAQLAYMPYYGAMSTDAAQKLRMFATVPPCALAEYVMPGTGGGTSFKTAFDIASAGDLSYLCDTESPLGEQLARAVRAQIFSYQDDSALVVRGDLYRPYTPFGTYCYALVSKDKSSAHFVYINDCAVGADKPARIKLVGLDVHDLYHVRELGKTFSGAALVGYGVDVGAVEAGETAVFHLRQVADYEE